nr:hypothetical protein [Tanacetum cinerariifolium]
QHEPAKVHEVVEVVTAAKLVYEVTVSSETAASAIILAAEPQVPAATMTVAPTRTKEQMEEEESIALQTINETPTEKAAKKRRLNEKVEDLKRHLEIVPNEDDD